MGLRDYCADWPPVEGGATCRWYRRKAANGGFEPTTGALTTGVTALFQHFDCSDGVAIGDFFRVEFHFVAEVDLVEQGRVLDLKFHGHRRFAFGLRDVLRRGVTALLCP